ncbi:hypothetical protein Nepgr_003085 [Nepenthes gracilis]|uniref:PB1 domain-containing protein n=1 Tax=Nepenthes gracilis TaxID=150966 RepID=A0AAD3XDB9_NEPGR|nr:hypothetical protein Nepgr_003085 [Nepenthes gracilis]
MTTAQLKGTNSTVKFLCSYGGKILPRPSDGKLRYVGGHTRVLSVDRSVSFSELMVKLEELCGFSVTLRCQLPSEDLDVLVSIKSDEDLANVIEEYDRANSSSMSTREQKIRAVLSSSKSLKSVSVSLSASSVDFSPTKSIHSDHLRPICCSGAPRSAPCYVNSSTTRSKRQDHCRSNYSVAPKLAFCQNSAPVVRLRVCANSVKVELMKTHSRRASNVEGVNFVGIMIEGSVINFTLEEHRTEHTSNPEKEESSEMGKE